MKPVSRSILITGVSTGIGYGAAKQFVRKGYTVFGSVRTQTDADRLQTELGVNFVPLLFDVPMPSPSMQPPNCSPTGWRAAA